MGTALDLLAGDLAVATEVTNMAVALGDTFVESRNVDIFQQERILLAWPPSGDPLSPSSYWS